MSCEELYSRYKTTNTFLLVLLILAVFIEAGYLNSRTIGSRTAVSKLYLNQKNDYNDYSKDAVYYLKVADKGFYRINKTERKGGSLSFPFNDAKAQGYFGTSSYASFNQIYYTRFLEEMKIIKKGDEFESRFSTGLATHPLIWSIASIKYYLCFQPNNSLKGLGYDSLAQTGNVIIYKNRQFLPLGFTYTRYIPFDQFKKLSDDQKFIVLQKACVAEEPILLDVKKKLTIFNLKDTSKSYPFSEYLQDISRLRTDTLSTTQFHENHILGSITIRTPGLLFFSIPFDKGWRALVDGKRVEPVLCNIGFTGLMLERGKHSIELQFIPRYFSLSMVFSIVGIILYLGLLLIDILIWKKGPRFLKVFFFNR
ncbi:MAG: YfhO family protein [Bacteroidetes bacterium]|nr:YfhO family protein [Bacteroidota bacterium]